MKDTNLSTTLCDSRQKSLSRWEDVIKQAKRQVAEMKRSIRVFEEMRDSGMEFPVVKRKRRKSQRATFVRDEGGSITPSEL